MNGSRSQHRRAPDRACPGEPPGQGLAPQSPGATRPTATARLLASARPLGTFGARDLDEAGQFPCQVIRTEDGYRVPFGALVRVLRSRLGLGSSSGPWPPDSHENSQP